VQILAIEDASSSAAPFRVVHRGVGGSHHIIGGSEAVQTYGDADAGRYDLPIGPDLVRYSERFVEALRNDQRRLLRGHVVEEHDELISTNPSSRVAGPERGTKAGRRYVSDARECLVRGRRPHCETTNSWSHASADASLSNSRVGNRGLLTRRKKFAIIRLSAVPATRARVH
jgi:hypothetical protein